MEGKIQEWLKQQKPFVVYRKPNEVKRFGWFQKNDELFKTNNLTESCFVFAPFKSEEIVFFPFDVCDVLIDESKVKESKPSTYIDREVSKDVKEFHVDLVRKTIQKINNSKIDKVVISRCEEVDVTPNDYQTYYNRFLNKYPTAFVYWFYHPKVGMWMGATPEKLLQFTNSEISTVALAGTQVDHNHNIETTVWGDKEKKEQQIVTDFIVDALKPFTKNIKTTLPYTFKAGSLLHLKTDIQANVDDSSNLFKIVNALHPTPALCGYPKQEAKLFIIENEGYDREYYGGFLGEWMFNDAKPSTSCDLFVNLRCLKIIDSKGYLYIGGGINADSNPENEYQETVNKSKTVKSVL